MALTTNNESSKTHGRGIQTDRYCVDEVSFEQVDEAYDKSEFLSEQSHLDLVGEASNRMKEEPSFVRKNLRLVIKLKMSSLVPGERLKYIEIKAGNGDNEIICFYDNKEMSWVYTKQTKYWRMYNMAMNAIAKCVPGTSDIVTCITQFTLPSFVWSGCKWCAEKLKLYCYMFKHLIFKDAPPPTEHK